MGVSGSGKTTLAHALQQRLDLAYAEADDFHPAANITKMQAGTPLDDADRWPWLAALTEWMTAQHAAGIATVVTCSALKRSYRGVLDSASGEVAFVHLAGDASVIAQRMTARTDHFMPTSLLSSQIAALEELKPEENGLTLSIDATPEDLLDAVLRWLSNNANTTTRQVLAP